MKGKIIIFSLLFLGFSLTPVFALTPTESIHFDDSDTANLIFKGSYTVDNQDNLSYSLNGLEDYLILEPNLPEKVNDFAVSVWVKPDYKVGIPATLSIISQSNAFNLSVNNDKIEKNVALFSIFDGIKWHQVQSKSTIPEKWTQISAIYSENQIKIFVNGIQENSQSINGDYSLTHQYGKSTQNNNDFILSESNVIIGAFDPSLRTENKIKNNFSGKIDDIMIFETALLKDQVFKFYQNGRVSHNPIKQNIEQPISPKVGITNIYGFVFDPTNQNDQKIEEISYVGYKIKKSSSRTNHSIINESSNQIFDNSFTNEIKNNDQTPKLDDKNNPNNDQTPKLDDKNNPNNDQTPKLDDKNNPNNDQTPKLDDKNNPNNDQTPKLDDKNNPNNKKDKPIFIPSGFIAICHLPVNGVGSPHTFFVSSSVVDFHLNHGDSLGKCL